MTQIFKSLNRSFIKQTHVQQEYSSIKMTKTTKLKG